MICRNNQHCSISIPIPQLSIEKPPVTFNVVMEESLTKGSCVEGFVLVHNHSQEMQNVKVILNKKYPDWVMNGVMERDYQVWCE